MKMLRLSALVALLLASPAAAQWQTPNHSVPVGRGVGVTGFGSAAPGAALLPLVSNGATSDPSFQALSNGGLATAPADTVKCNPTAFVASVQDCTVPQISALLSGNVRNVSGTDPIVTTDCGGVVLLGGSAFYTETVPAASGFPAGCKIFVVNVDNICPTNGAATCRAKLAAVNGYASFRLWPGQVLALTNQVVSGVNVWTYPQPGRWAPLVGMTWHINHGAGSDAGDGLATGLGAFATIQQCINVVESLIDFGQANVGPTCQNDSETFTENNVSHTHPLTGFHVISITGNTTTPGSVVWQVSGTGNVAMNCRDTGLAIVTGFKFVSTGTGNFFLNGGQSGVVDFGFVEFGANPGGFHLYQSSGGGMGWSGGSVTLSGNMSGFFLSTGEGHLIGDGMTVSIPAPLTFGNFVQMGPLGMASITSTTFTGAGAGAGSTGSKYSVTLNAVLGLSGTVLPGASAGTTATGGQVVP